MRGVITSAVSNPIASPSDDLCRPDPEVRQPRSRRGCSKWLSHSRNPPLSEADLWASGLFSKRLIGVCHLHVVSSYYLLKRLRLEIFLGRVSIETLTVFPRLCS